MSGARPYGQDRSAANHNERGKRSSLKPEITGIQVSIKFDTTQVNASRISPMMEDPKGARQATTGLGNVQQPEGPILSYVQLTCKKLVQGG